MLLSAFAVVCTLLVSATYVYTQPLIEQQAKNEVLNNLNQVLNNQRFNNNPLLNCSIVDEPEITGGLSQVPIYKASFDGQPYALVYQTQTKQGYNGTIKLIVAVDNKNSVQGVRVLGHQETPGLGDKIEASKSNWIFDFNEQLITENNQDRWQVKKDGGVFDQFTGATITPRAIVNQLRTSLNYVTANFERLYQLKNDCAVPAQTNENQDTLPTDQEMTNDNSK